MMPSCSQTKRRSVPGARVMARGRLNFRPGNALTVLNGGGGSGWPTTRDVVQAARLDSVLDAAGSEVVQPERTIGTIRIPRAWFMGRSPAGEESPYYPGNS